MHHPASSSRRRTRRPSLLLWAIALWALILAWLPAPPTYAQGPASSSTPLTIKQLMLSPGSPYTFQQSTPYYEAGTTYANTPWTWEIGTTQAVYATDTLTLTAPATTQFPTDPADYQITGEATQPGTGLTVTAVYVGGGGSTVTLDFGPGPNVSPSGAYVASQPVQIIIDHVINPQPGTYPAGAFTAAFDGETPVGLTTPPDSLQFVQPPLAGLSFNLSSVQSGTLSQWNVTFWVYNALNSGDTLTVTGPPGTTFIDNPSLVSLSTPGGSVPIQSAFYPGSGKNSVSLVLNGSVTATASNPTPATLQLYEVTNPPPGSYPLEESYVAVNDTEYAFPSQPLAFGGLTWTPLSSVVAGATATWEASLVTPVAVYADQPLSLTAPWTFPASTSNYQAMVNNQTASIDALTASGQTLTVALGQSVSPGQTITLTVSGVTNPAAGFLAPSAWTATVGSVSWQASQGDPVVAQQTDVSASVSSYQAEASGVTWTVSFPAEAALSSGDTIQITAEGVTFPSQADLYTVTAGSGSGVAPAAVSVSDAVGCTTACQVVLTMPQGLSIAPLTPVQVQILGVTNPATPNVALSVATSGVPQSAPLTWPPAGSAQFSAQPATAAGGSGGAAVDLSPMQQHPLPSASLVSGPDPSTAAPVTIAMQPLGDFTCADNFQSLLSSGNFSSYTCSQVLWSPTSPPGSGAAPVANYPSSSPSVFVVQSPTISLRVFDATGCPNPPADLNLPQQVIGCNLEVSVDALQNTGTGTTLTPLPSQYTPDQSFDHWGTLVFTLPGVYAEVTVVETVDYYMSNTVPVTGTCTEFYDPATKKCTNIVVAYSAPITITEAPTALEQLDVLPFKILYQPPGDGSTNSYSMSKNQSTSTDYSLTQSTSNSTSATQNASLAFEAGFSYFGWGVWASNNAEWDSSAQNAQTQSTTTDHGVTYTLSSGQSWTTPYGSSDPTVAPWQQDEFILLVHPQFAVWDQMVCMANNGPVAPVVGQSGTSCPEGSAPVSANGMTATPYSMIGANPILLTVTAQQLQQCLTDGTPIAVNNNGYSPPVGLTPTECGQLLQLDPYATQQTQAPSLSGSFTSVNTVIQNSKGSSTTINLSQESISTQGTTINTDYSASFDTAFVDTFGVQAGLDGSYADDTITAKVVGGATFTVGQGQSVTQDTSISTSSTKESDYQHDASATLEDSNTPMDVQVYLDPRWDTLMFSVPPIQLDSQTLTAASGANVTVTGSGFADRPLSVLFCADPNQPATCEASPNFSPVSGQNDSELTVQVPPDLTPGSYTLVVQSWGAEASEPITITSPTGGPTITEVTPSKGSTGGGTLVTIRGTSLSGADGVWFGISKPSNDPSIWQAEQSSNGTNSSFTTYVAPASSFAVVNDSTILACAPQVPQGEEVTVAVHTPVGWTSANSNTAFTFTTDSGSTACNPSSLEQAPVVTGISPTAGPASGGTVVTVYGSGLGYSPTETTVNNSIAQVLLPPTVNFCNGSDCTASSAVRVLNAHTLQAVAPPGSAGTVDIEVQNMNEQSSSPSVADAFTYTNGAGGCNSSAPACSPGSLSLWASPPAILEGVTQPVTVAAMVLSPGGQPISGVSVAFSASVGTLNASSATTDSTGTAVVDWTPPANGQTATLEARIGSPATLGAAATVSLLPLPVVTGLNPASGSYQGGTPVTLSGTGFTGATTVYFGSQAVPASPGPSGTLQAIAPPGTGQVQVKVGNAAGIEPASATFSYTGASPLIITTTQLPNATQGQTYTQQLAASGGVGQDTWQVAPGSTLPPGLSLASDGTLSGAPSGSGPYSFAVTVTDAQGETATVTLGLLVEPSGVAVAAVTASGSTTSGTTPAQASLPQVQATGSGGTGSVTVSQYQGNPESTAPSEPATAYYDLSASAGSSFTQVQAAFCGLSSTSVLEYWNGSTWTPVNPQQYDASTGCIDVTFSATSTPPLSALTGTPFAAVTAAGGGGGSPSSGGGGGAESGSGGGSGSGGVSGSASATTQLVSPGTPATLTATTPTGATVTVSIPADAVSESATFSLNAAANLATGANLATTPLAVLQVTATPSSGGTLPVFGDPLTVTLTQPSGATPGNTALEVLLWNPLRQDWQPVPGVTGHGAAITWALPVPGLLAVVPSGTVPAVDRLAGADRIGTAIAAAEAAYPDGAQAVILANAGQGAPSPDALAAAGLAGALHAPILLSPAAAVPDAVLAAIAALGAKTVYVIGGPAAISDAAVAQLTQAGLTVVRQFEGQDRVQTARLIDSYLYQQHLTQATTLYVANGVSMVDALAASPWLARAAAPLWLVSPGETALPSAALTWLEQANIHQVVLLGGPAAVAPEIAQQLSSLGVQVSRLAGADRDGTAAAIAAQAFPHPAGAILAADGSRGSSFVDALAAGPLGAVWNLPVVLSGPNQLPGATASYLQALSPSSVWVMGGPAAINASVLQALDSLMGTPSP